MEGDIGSAVKLLRDAVSCVGAQVSPLASDAEVAAGLWETVTELRRLQAVVVTEVAELEHRRVAGREGYGTTATWLQDLLRTSRGEAQTLVRRARTLAPRVSSQGERLAPVYEHTAAAFREGAIGAEHVKEIEDVLHRLPPHVDEQEQEQADAELAELARKATPIQVRKAGIHLLARLDPDGPEPDDHGRVPRAFRVGMPTAGACPLSGMLDPEAAELVQTALNNLNAPAPATDGTRDPRGFEQRNADALVELARRFLAGDTGPANGGSAYRVVVTLGLDDLYAAYRATTPAAGTRPAGTGAAETGAAGTTATGAPVSAAAVRRMACDAGVIPVVLGSEGQPLDVGREYRLATPAIRQALAVRDKGCAFPTCDRPPEWTEAHHTPQWTHGGRTSVHTMTLLCCQHHTLIHNSDWEVFIDTDGLPTFIPPSIIDPQRQPRCNPRITERSPS